MKNINPQHIESMLHSFHQYSYLPVVLFTVALLIFISSISNQKSQARYLGYLVALAIVICCVFIL